MEGISLKTHSTDIKNAFCHVYFATNFILWASWIYQIKWKGPNLKIK